MDVFALQIDGEKTWQIYEGRFTNPIEQPGYNYSTLPKSHHEVAKGKLLKQSVMTPGDVLYIPRGQYHEALASKQASLHLSFGITEATGRDFLNILLNSLSEDSLFRAALPHFDRSDAHLEHLDNLASQLQKLCAQEDSSALMRDYQKRRAFRNIRPGFTLPNRTIDTTYRVRVFSVVVTHKDTETVVECDAQQARFTGQDISLIHWVRQQDLFTRIDVQQAFPIMTDKALRELLGALTEVGLIEPI